MKQLTIVLFYLFLATFINAQTTIDNPVIGICNRTNVFITHVELTEEATIITLNVKLPVGASNTINKNDYIQIAGDTTKLKAVKCLDYKFGESVKIQDENGLIYRTVFPPIDSSVTKINYIDPHPSGWKFCDIEIRKQAHESLIPKEILGNWFLTESGRWTFSFLDSLAICDNQIWKYESVKQQNDIHEIVISHDNAQKILQCKLDYRNDLFIRFKGEEYMHYSNVSTIIYNSLEEKEKEDLLFEPKKTIYSGLIRNYNQQLETWVSVRYTNKLNNEPFAKVVDIQKDGSFSFELEIEGPQEIGVRLPTGSEEIFLLPGKNLFHLVNSGSKEIPSLFMGESANVVLRHRIIRRMESDLQIRNRLTELSEEEYLNLILTASKKDLDKLIEPEFKNIRVKDKLFFVPRRSIELIEDDRKITVSNEGFWISNEITNSEYREFANDILLNPNEILRWEESKYNSSKFSYENVTEVQIYSEVAKNLIDSSLMVTVFYNGKLQPIKIIEYLNDEDFDNFPVTGVPLNGAKYYCIWLNKKNDIEGAMGFHLPSEINVMILTDYLKRIKNSRNSPLIENILYEVPKDTIAYLNNNVQEWYRRSTFGSGLYPHKKFTIIKIGEKFDNVINPEHDDINTPEYAGFRIVLSAPGIYLLKEKSSSKLIIMILGFTLFFLIITFIIWKLRARQRLKKEEQLRKQRELELTAIRSQMNPHFLFNSLNSVQNLVQQNKGREAHLYLSDFAGLIRKVLHNSEKEEVSLAEEVEMVEQYLNLEKLRFDFNYSVSVDKDIDPYNTLVPSMLLQPFVENAVIHGLQSKPENRDLIIEIRKKKSAIRISIEDNGVGREEAKKITKAKNGKGSKLIQERLEILQEKQGEKYSLKIIDLENETGTRVEILIPEEK